MGDEGGFAPRFSSHEAALDIIIRAIEKANYKPGREVFIALDTASSEFYDKKTCRYAFTVRGKKKKLTADQLVAYYAALAQKYPIISIEDGCAEDDWEGWKLLTEKLRRNKTGANCSKGGKKMQVVGDDLFATNSVRLAFTH